jgi:hypothetical protein
VPREFRAVAAVWGVRASEGGWREAVFPMGTLGPEAASRRRRLPAGHAGCSRPVGGSVNSQLETPTLRCIVYVLGNLPCMEEVILNDFQSEE